MTYSLLLTLSDNHPDVEEDDYQCEALTQSDLLAELKMVLTSRVRYTGIEKLQLINSSVLNFGIDESFQKNDEMMNRRIIMERRLAMAIARYEPRLTHVVITGQQINAEEIKFTLQAFYLEQPLTIEMKWDDAAGVFYFYE